MDQESRCKAIALLKFGNQLNIVSKNDCSTHLQTSDPMHPTAIHCRNVVFSMHSFNYKSMHPHIRAGNTAFCLNDTAKCHIWAW